MAPLQLKESAGHLKFASDQSISELTKQNAQKIVQNAPARGLHKRDAHPNLILALEFDSTISAGMPHNRLANNEQINYIRELIGRPRIESTEAAARDFIYEKPQPLTEDEIKKLASEHDQLDSDRQAELQVAIGEFARFELCEKGLGMRMPAILDSAIAGTIRGGGMVFIATRSHYTDEIKALLTERLRGTGYDKEIANSIGIVGSAEESNGTEPNKAEEHISYIKASVEKAFKEATGNKEFKLGNSEICLVDAFEQSIKNAENAHHSVIHAVTPFAWDAAKDQLPIQFTEELVDFLKANPSDRDPNAYSRFSISMQALEDERLKTLTEINKGDATTVDWLKDFLAKHDITIVKPAMKSANTAAPKPEKKVSFGEEPTNMQAGRDESVAVSAKYHEPEAKNPPLKERDTEFYALKRLELEARPSMYQASGLKKRNPADALFTSIAKAFPGKEPGRKTLQPFKEVGMRKAIANALSIGTSLQKLEIQPHLPKRPDMVFPVEALALLGNNVGQFPKVTVQLPIDRQTQTVKAGEISFSANFNAIAKAIMKEANELFPVPGNATVASRRSSAALKEATEGLSNFLSKAFVATLPKAMALVDATSKENHALRDIQTLEGLAAFKEFCSRSFVQHHRDLGGEVDSHLLISSIDDFIGLMKESQAQEGPNAANMDLQLQEGAIIVFNHICKTVDARAKDLRLCELERDGLLDKIEASTSAKPDETQNLDTEQKHRLDELKIEIPSIKASLDFYRELMEHLDPYAKPSDPTQNIENHTMQNEKALQSAISFNAGGGTSTVYFNNEVDAFHRYVGTSIEEQQRYITEVVELAVAMAIGTSNVPAMDALRAVDSKEKVVVEPHEMLKRVLGNDDIGNTTDDYHDAAELWAARHAIAADFVRNRGMAVRSLYELDLAKNLFDPETPLEERSTGRRLREQSAELHKPEHTESLKKLFPRSRFLTPASRDDFIRNLGEKYAAFDLSATPSATGETGPANLEGKQEQQPLTSSANPSHRDRQQQNASPTVAEIDPKTSIALSHLSEKVTEAVKHSGQALTGAGVGKADLGEGGGRALSDSATMADHPDSTPSNINKAKAQKVVV